MFLVHNFFAETVEELSTSKSIYDTEMKKMHHIIQQLQKENADLLHEKAHQAQVSHY